MIDPPKNEPRSQALAKALKGEPTKPLPQDPGAFFKSLLIPPDFHKDVPVQLRGQEVTIRFRLITMAERERCTGAGIKRLEKLGVSASIIGERNFNDQLADSCCTEILAGAMRYPDPTGRVLFESGDDVRKYLTPDEVAYLFRTYSEVSDELNGFDHYADIMKDLDGWIEKASLGAELDFLGLLPSVMLRELCQVLSTALLNIRFSQPELYFASLESLNPDGSTPGSSAVPSSSTEVASAPQKGPARNTKGKAPKLLTPEEIKAQAETL